MRRRNIALTAVGLLATATVLMGAANRPVDSVRAASSAKPTGATGARLQVDTASRDAILRLQTRLDAGEVSFQFDSTLGYLPSLLRALKIPPSSQGLVFSRTSLQTDLIAPWSPRAVYFNDDVYIGYVPESAFLEVAVVNPAGGATFYTLNQDSRAPPKFLHEPNGCSQCHLTRATSDVPGFVLLSTLADRDGYAITPVQNGSTTDATAIEKRFGGWYVTGTHGTTGHSGNVIAPKLYSEVADKEQYLKEINLNAESARTDLNGKVSTTRYIARYSDIVALMVLVHQTSVHNLITVVHREAIKAQAEQLVVSRYRGDTSNTEPLENSNAKFRVAVERLVRSMLFIDETPFHGAIHESTTFTKDFSQPGPRDKSGRSLRDFDLERRLFKYPLSFLIYSEGFASLPEIARGAVYRRLRVILNGADSNPDFAKLSASDRQAISEILVATKPEYSKLGSN
ncbi:MAG: hypothetical protein ABJC26_04955 [Gemmatimonadaceae bacterium]